MINDGKLKFEKLDGPIEFEDPFMAKVEMPRQWKRAPREASPEKVAITKGKVPISKVRRSEIGSSLTTEGSKERSREPNWEEKKKVL